MNTFLIIWASIGIISYICFIMTLLRSKLKAAVMKITETYFNMLIAFIVAAIMGPFMLAAIFYEVRYRMKGEDWPRSLFEDK